MTDGGDGHKDYSGTPLWKKLGIKDGSRVLIEHGPDGFDAQLSALAPLPHQVEFLPRLTKGIDVVVLFTAEQKLLERRFHVLASRLVPTGRLWIAWPKKASGLATDLTFALVQGHGLEHGMVDNKTASVTDTFQGCQFVYRLKDRPPIR